MKTGLGTRALAAGVIVASVMVACSQTAPPSQNSPATDATSASSSTILGITPMVGTIEAHFNPTEAIGGGANGSNPVVDLSTVFASVQQASQLKINANSSPPGATGPDVQSVSVIAQDSDGLLKSLDATGKQTLGNALLTAAGAAWPNASISLLVSDPTGGGGSIIGNRPKGGQNTVIAT